MTSRLETSLGSRRMSGHCLVDLSIVFFSLVGCVAGALYGYRQGSFLGAALRIVVGFFCGMFLGGGLVRGMEYIGIQSERRDNRRSLRNLFGAYWRQDKREKWLRAVRDTPPSSLVVGRVVCVKYYGVFLDIGLSFPALLTKLQMAEDVVRQPSKCPGIGDVVSAWIEEYDHRDSMIILTQDKETKWVEYQNTIVGLLPYFGKSPMPGSRPLFSFKNDASEELSHALKSGTATRCSVRTTCDSVVWLVKGDSRGFLTFVEVTCPHFMYQCL